MRRSKLELYLHLVWATERRKSCLDERIECPIYRCIESEAQRLGCTVLALNGMPDHVHLVVQLASGVAVARLAQGVKGVSSAMINEHLGLDEHFAWQQNYAAFSVSRSHLKRVIAYVERQKEHHASDRLWNQCEQCDEEIPDLP